jgi:hypothetical protein
MNSTYIGSKRVDVKDTPYKDYTKSDWALEYIMHYGGIDGAHHKTWVLDQVVRILNGCNIIIELHEWTDHESEYRFYTDEPNQQYKDWVAKCKDGDDGPDTYDYDTGIAP